MLMRFGSLSDKTVRAKLKKWRKARQGKNPKQNKKMELAAQIEKDSETSSSDSEESKGDEKGDSEDSFDEEPPKPDGEGGMPSLVTVSAV